MQLGPLVRAISGMQTAFVSDALAMPVRWHYDPKDILAAFSQGRLHPTTRKRP